MVALRVAVKTSCFGGFDPKCEYINEERRQVARDIEAAAAEIAKQLESIPNLTMSKHRHVVFSWSYKSCRLAGAGSCEFNVMSQPHFMYIIAEGSYNPIAIDLQGQLYYQVNRFEPRFTDEVFFWKAFGDISKSTLETLILRENYLSPLKAWLIRASAQNA
jgi:hypothetical protein